MNSSFNFETFNLLDQGKRLYKILLLVCDFFTFKRSILILSMLFLVVLKP